MRIVNISDEALARIKDQLMDIEWAAKYKQAIKDIQAAINAPVPLLYVRSVTYDPKTDRYTATFSGSEKTATLRVTEDVAEFLATNLREPGTWWARMEKGILVDIYLFQLLPIPLSASRQRGGPQI